MREERERGVECWDYVEEAARWTGRMQIMLTRIRVGSIYIYTYIMLKGKVLKVTEGCFGKTTEIVASKERVKWVRKRKGLTDENLYSGSVIRF
jgi:isocitrate dehydrogenase